MLMNCVLPVHLQEQLILGDLELNKEIMPEISNFYGIVIYMYVSEHNPPHSPKIKPLE